MVPDLRIGYIFGVTITILLIFISAELLEKHTNLNTEATRKMVHINSGIVTLFFPHLFPSHISVMILSAIFILFLAVSLKFHFLNSIHGIQRKSLGSIGFPTAIYFCFIAFKQTEELIYYFLPVLILIICDPLAAIVGIKIKSIRYAILKDSKTLAGSLAFFLAAFLLSVCMLIFQQHIQTVRALTYSCFIAVCTTITEAISPWGLDNLFVPLTALICLHLVFI